MEGLEVERSSPTRSETPDLFFGEGYRGYAMICFLLQILNALSGTGHLQSQYILPLSRIKHLVGISCHTYQKSYLLVHDQQFLPAQSNPHPFASNGL